MTTPIFTRLAAISIAAALSGCVVSDDPYFHAAATTGTAASLLYYSLDDGYYYDHRYNRLPHTYRPAYGIPVQRIESMNAHRRHYPIEAHMHRQNRMLSDRIYRQRINNRILENRLEQQRLDNRRLQHQLDRQRLQNLHMQQRMEDSRNRSMLLRERTGQQQRSRQAQQNALPQHTTNQPQRVYRSNEFRWLNRQAPLQLPPSGLHPYR